MTEHSAPTVAQLMAGIVDNRVRMWELVEEVTARPEAAVVERLVSGQWIADMQEGVQWLGDAAERFRPGVQSVEAAVDEGPATLESLTAGHDAIVARERASLSETISDLMGQLAAERRAWSGGDGEYAKTLRLAEHDLLHKRMVPAIQQWCFGALHQRSSPILAAIVKVVGIVLSMETGRDFMQGMDGREFSITDDLPKS